MNPEIAIKLIKRSLSNRLAGPEIDWDNDEIYKTVKKFCDVKDISAFTEKDLDIDNIDTIFCFVLVNAKESSDFISKAPEVIKKALSTAVLIERMKKGEKVVFVVIVNDLKTRVCIETNWRTIVQDLKKKLDKGCKLRCECDYLVGTTKISKTYELSHIDRYSILQEPELINTINLKLLEPDSFKRLGYVTSVDLSELIELYNQIGDCLFDDNVRYAISDQMGVDQAIEDTLKKAPDMFWYRNNGITILVKSDKFELNHPNKIVLGMNNNESFSVINGAQTICASSRLFFSLRSVVDKKNEELRTKYKGDDDAQKEAKEKLKTEIEKYKKQIEGFKKARVLLRIIWSKDDSNNAESRSISVALNRQKPIKQEDIAYTLDYTNDIAKRAEEFEPKRFSFSLIKRGADEADSVDLVELSKIRLACINKPLKARNSSAATSLSIMSDDQGQLFFKDTEIFPVINIDDDFKKYYFPVRIARDIAYYYEKNVSEFKRHYKPELEKDNKDICNRITLITNAKWFMISHLIIYTNKNISDDYSKFDENCEDLLNINCKSLFGMMDEYFKQFVDKLGEKPIDNKFFKNDSWYVDNKDSINMDKVLNARFTP